MMKTVHRRQFLNILAAGAAVGAFARILPRALAAVAPAGPNIVKISKIDEEWKKTLTPEQYNVLRKEGTEAPFTSPLNHEKRAGTFACAGCALPLFMSTTKFDSGTGWPSFFDHIPGQIETKVDKSMFMTRTEYHCARCGGHQGHIFEDGPKPTGLRHCNNGVALNFIPDKTG